MPRKNETLEITVPNLSDNKPSNISVLVNGNKIAEDKKNYDVDKNILTITNETKGIWSSNVNKYKIIYVYCDFGFYAGCWIILIYFTYSIYINMGEFFLTAPIIAYLLYMLKEKIKEWLEKQGITFGG